MKQIFISIPIHGKTPREIDAAIYECIDWWEKNHPPADSYVHNDIQKLGQCDAIIMGKGWIDAKGCCIEQAVAKTYGIDVYYYVEDKNGKAQEPKTNTDRGV